jgi:hypothetical protein
MEPNSGIRSVFQNNPCNFSENPSLLWALGPSPYRNIPLLSSPHRLPPALSFLLNLHTAISGEWKLRDLCGKGAAWSANAALHIARDPVVW